MSSEDLVGDGDVWMGIDLGTTSVKVVLLDSQGIVVASDSKPTEANVVSDIGSSGHEQNPCEILKTVVEITLPIFKQHKWCIKGIGITGQMHGVVLWGPRARDGGDVHSQELGTGINCSNLYTWEDQRCSKDFLASLPRPSNQRHPLATGHGCATLYWLVRHHPELMSSQEFTNCGSIMDLLACCLCDVQRAVTSDQLAASLGYYCEDSGQWDAVLYEDAAFPSHLLPTVVPVCTKVGHTRTNVSDWPNGVPVYVSMGDVQCSTFALLRDRQDSAMNISTSVQLGFVMSPESVKKLDESAHPSLSFFPYFNGQYLCLCAGLNGGNALGYFADCVGNWVIQLGFAQEVSVPDIIEKLQNLAEQEQPSSEQRLTFRPSFYGERHNTSLRGCISGLNGNNLTSIGQMFHAASEGLLDHVHDMIPADFLISLGISRLLVSGSVVTKNSVLKRRLMELYSVKSLEVVMASGGNEAVGSAVGAALVIMRNIMKPT